MECSKCGAEILSGKKFCMKCGASALTAAAPTPPMTAPVEEEPPAEETEPRSRGRKIRVKKQAAPAPGGAPGPDKNKTIIFAAIGGGVLIAVLVAVYFLAFRPGADKPGPPPAPAPRDTRVFHPQRTADLIPADTMLYAEVFLAARSAAEEETGAVDEEGLVEFHVSPPFKELMRRFRSAPIPGLDKEAFAGFIDRIEEAMSLWSNGEIVFAVPPTQVMDQTVPDPEGGVFIFGVFDHKFARADFPGMLELVPAGLKGLGALAGMPVELPAMKGADFGREIEYGDYIINCSGPEPGQEADAGRPAPCWAAAPLGVILTLGEDRIKKSLDAMTVGRGDKAAILAALDEMPADRFTASISNMKPLQNQFMQVFNQQPDPFIGFMAAVDGVASWSVLTQDNELLQNISIGVSPSITVNPYLSRLMAFEPDGNKAARLPGVPGMVGFMAVDRHDRLLKLVYDNLNDRVFWEGFSGGAGGVMARMLRVAPERFIASLFYDTVGLFVEDDIELLIEHSAGEAGVVFMGFKWLSDRRVPDMNIVSVLKVKDMDAFKEVVRGAIRKHRLRTAARGEVVLIVFGPDEEASPAFGFRGDYFIWGRDARAVREVIKTSPGESRDDSPLMLWRMSVDGMLKPMLDKMVSALGSGPAAAALGSMPLSVEYIAAMEELYAGEIEVGLYIQDGELVFRITAPLAWDPVE